MELAPNYYQALYFSRAQVPYGATDFLEHIGIYGFKYDFLKQFVSWPIGQLEKLEKLEQLRAIERFIPCYYSLVESSPFSVDTEQDLELVRSLAEA